MEHLKWLPLSKDEIQLRGWEAVDVIIVSGDAYVDHPSFGHAMVGRLIESKGLKVAILPQPNWRDDLRDFKKLGKPNLFFGVTAGCMDSMINHYTSFKRLRSDDAYTPGGKSGFRPDYATIVYTKILKKLFPETPVVLGGVEASLRRFTHYDYWSNSLKPSVLSESGADLLIYGQGILPMLKLIDLLQEGRSFAESSRILQTAYLSNIKNFVPPENSLELPSHEVCIKSKQAFAEAFKIIETESNKLKNQVLFQKVGKAVVVVNPPFQPMTTKETDLAYNLPFTRQPHPKYKKRGEIPAYLMIRHSINIHSGCFGGCSFCSISMHQGKYISSRSVESIVKEANQVVEMPDFKGYISDLGGPSANMWKMQGKKMEICRKCSRFSCIYPALCNNLDDNHGPLVELYRKIRNIKGVKKVFVNSGLRYDMFIDKDNEKEKHYREYFSELVTHHVSGRLKVAPEHTSEHVLKLIRKPSFSYFSKLSSEFRKISEKAALKQQIVPYFISGHPGCSLEDMADCAYDIKKADIRPEQVQDFTPTPMTLSSVMYYTGIDPYTGKKLYVARSTNEKKQQKLMYFWHVKQYQNEIVKMLQKLNKKELIKKLIFKENHG